MRSLARRSSPGRPRATALASEYGIESVEDRRAAGETLVVVARIRADTGDQHLDARGFLAAELAVLEVDVVDDLGDRRQRRIIETGSGQEHLEAAAVALMGKLGLEHIEAQLARLRRVASGRHELESGPLVDEPPDQPGTGDPVDVHALPGHPGAALEILESSVPRRRFL